MNFLYPGFLWALTALSIPIIIHLFSFRRFRTVYFSNVKFLREVKEQNASRSRLKHLLVLLMRLLAITFLVLAFAQPYIPRTEADVAKGSKSVSIYLDNSFSMDALGEQVSLIERGKDAAMELAEGYSTTDRFQILTNDFEGQHQRLVSRDQFANYLREIEVSPQVKPLDQVVARQMEALRGQENRTLYLISDFQKSITKLPGDTSAAPVYLVPMQAVERQNVAIDTAWMDAPVQMVNQTASIFVRLVNYGEEPVENNNVSVMVNGNRKAISDFSINPGSSIVDTLAFNVGQSGWNQGEITISDYPITFDDNYYFTFYTPRILRMLSINQVEPSPYISGIANEDLLRLDNSNVGQVDYAKLDQYHLIALNQLNQISSGLASELKSYVDNGGKLLVFPGQDMEKSSYDNFLNALGTDLYGELREQEQSVKSINIEEGLYANVFEELPENMMLPNVTKYYPLQQGTFSGAENLLTLNNGDPILAKYGSGSGQVFLAGVPPDMEYSGFPRHSLFAVTLMQIAITGTSSGPMAYTIGEDNSILVDNVRMGGDQNLKLQSLSSEGVDFFPPQRLMGRRVMINLSAGSGAVEQFKESGIYRLYLPDTDTTLQMLAFNYNRKESDISTYSGQELSDRYPNIITGVIDGSETDLSTVVGQINRGTPLWKWCLMLALVFLAAEIALLRLLPE